MINKKTNILIAYFSATDNTRKIAKKIEATLKELDITVTLLDITNKKNREKELEISQIDGLFFGFPVYSKRAPSVCRDWLKTLNGQEKKCSVFFTYGGFLKDPAHYFIQEQLKEQNFNLVSTSEFVAAHTFNLCGWEALKSRPNDEDFDIAKEYTLKTLKRFTNEDKSILKDFPIPEVTNAQLDKGELNKFKTLKEPPKRDQESCSMCKLCEKLCPTNAMDALTGRANIDLCIACMRCVNVCPDGVLHTIDLSDDWSNRLDTLKTTNEEMNKKQSKIYL